MLWKPASGDSRLPTLGAVKIQSQETIAYLLQGIAVSAVPFYLLASQVQSCWLVAYHHQSA